MWQSWYLFIQLFTNIFGNSLLESQATKSLLWIIQLYITKKKKVILRDASFQIVTTSLAANFFFHKYFLTVRQQIEILKNYKGVHLINGIGFHTRGPVKQKALKNNIVINKLTIYSASILSI